MNPNGQPSKPRKFEPTLLDVGNDQTPPFFVWRGSDEESLRPVSTEDILFLLSFKVIGPAFRATAIAELERRGVSPPQHEA
jgi:hypothetical protein